MFDPLGPQATAFGVLTSEAPDGGATGNRVLKFANGYAVGTVMESAADITKPVGGKPMADAFGLTPAALENGGKPATYQLAITAETPPAGGQKICGEKKLTAALLRQPDTPTDKTMTLVFLTARPGEPAAEVCTRLVYTSR